MGPRLVFYAGDCVAVDGGNRLQRPQGNNGDLQGVAPLSDPDRRLDSVYESGNTTNAGSGRHVSVRTAKREGFRYLAGRTFHCREPMEADHNSAGLCGREGDAAVLDEAEKPPWSRRASSRP